MIIKKRLDATTLKTILNLESELAGKIYKNMTWNEHGYQIKNVYEFISRIVSLSKNGD